VSSSYAESIQLDEADALSIARGIRSRAAEVRHWVGAAGPESGPVAEVPAGFPGFGLGAVAVAAAASTANANKALGDTMQQIGDMTVLCVDAFHHTDHANKMGLERTSTWEAEK